MQECIPKYKEYKNNFYLVFCALFFQRADEKIPFFTKIYLVSAEASGQKWQDFLTENEKLVEKILLLIEQIYIYTELEEEYEILLKENNLNEAYQLNYQALLLRSLTWNELYPLLVEADEKMQMLGINTQELYK